MNWFKKENNEKEIIFESSDDHVFNVREKPIPAADILPNWWKNMPHYSNSEQKLKLNPGPTVTAKRCLSALDSLSSGYIITLWADLLVTSSEEFGTHIQWNTEMPVADIWQESQVSTYEIPNGYDKNIFKYLHGWIIKTPPGWSSLIIHPLAYQNLPFKVIPGLVDTDKLKTDINTPFVIEKGFNGIIEKGTPMFQIIPIKRNFWKSKIIKGDPKQFEYDQENLRTKIISYYGRYLRVPKSYK